MGKRPDGSRNLNPLHTQFFFDLEDGLDRLGKEVSESWFGIVWRAAHRALYSVSVIWNEICMIAAGNTGISVWQYLAGRI
jgi:hypothetical protein